MYRPILEIDCQSNFALMSFRRENPVPVFWVGEPEPPVRWRQYDSASYALAGRRSDKCNP
jgi:hypothetical protein